MELTQEQTRQVEEMAALHEKDRQQLENFQLMRREALILTQGQDRTAFLEKEQALITERERTLERELQDLKDAFATEQANLKERKLGAEHEKRLHDMMEVLSKA